MKLAAALTQSSYLRLASMAVGVCLFFDGHTLVELNYASGKVTTGRPALRELLRDDWQAIDRIVIPTPSGQTRTIVLC